MSILKKMKYKRKGIPHGVYYRTPYTKGQPEVFMKDFILIRNDFDCREKEELFAQSYARFCPHCKINIVTYTKEMMEERNEDFIKLGSVYWFKGMEDLDDVRGSLSVFISKDPITYNSLSMQCPKCRVHYEVMYNLNYHDKEYKYPNEL